MSRSTLRPLIAAFAISCVLPYACAPKSKLTAPEITLSPYGSLREVLWAVVPPTNESGTTLVNPLDMGDTLVQAIEEAQGLRCVPLNRTLDAMRALEMPAVRTPGDARRLGAAMGVDGIVVGTLTAYDPYTPTLGLSLALFARPGSPGAGGGEPLKPWILEGAATEPTANGRVFSDRPQSTASMILDAKNHQVLMDLRRYATGRSDDDSALGWRRYTKSMALYSQFACHKAVEELLRSEWSRLAQVRHAGEMNPSASRSDRYADVPEGREGP
ncbi:MAG: hypothetical protein IPK69_03930 [Phycisphaerales bacterium]|nr:MAG: hypothetical protein IPK69_03930 [Phycisphaerales bacterium]